ncbi:hypothetical protein ACFY0F_37575 [Streptomyces sp. NPDC001544]|uniref:hypothetical protein n=1 Tax=Streptomyces sp. NPDC001544 TaxID=3364584 RepID=UPI003675EF61
MNGWVGELIKWALYAFVAGMFILVFSMSRYGRKKDEKIREGYARLAQIAPERGWTYQPRVQGQIDQYCGVRPFPGRGSNLRAWHYTTGEFRGRPFKYFEYRSMNLMSGADVGERKQPNIEAVFIVTAPGSGPLTQILRPSLLDRLFDRRPKVELGVPEFDKNFRIITRDEGFARKALSHDVVPYLLQDPKSKSSLQLRDNELFTWYRGNLSPQAVDEKLNYLCDVLDRMPAQTWSAA